jgi:hypothetical protein
MTELIDITHPDETHLLDVAFLDLNTNETARFAVPGDLVLQRAWDMAYDELGETRREADILESRSGQPLTGDLGETIRHIKEHVVPDLRFQIHGEQGGA